jgi:hypothetical protein
MKLAQVNQADFGTAPLPEAAANPVQKEGQDLPLVIATMPATERQRTIAVGIVILLTGHTDDRDHPFRRIATTCSERSRPAVRRGC